MRVEVDTHTHTVISGHAYSSVREMARMAAEKGLKAIALTDHAPQMPGSTHLFYFQNMRVVPRQMEGVELLMGVELNIMDTEGSVDLPDRVLKEMDIRIASMHMPCYQGEKTVEEVTKAYIRIMERGDIDIIGHPDDGRFPADYEELVKAAKRTGTLLELNNASLNPAGFRKNTKENSRIILELCKKHEVMIVLGTDAHVDTAIVEYPFVDELLAETNFPEKLIANTSLDVLKSKLKKYNNKNAGL